MYGAIEKTVDYAYRNKIDTIIVVGGRGRQFFELFRIIWNKKYKAPLNFVSLGQITRKEDVPTAHRPVKAVESLAIERLNKFQQKGLIKGNIMLFDEWLESGRTIRKFKGIAEKVIGKGVKTAVPFIFTGGKPYAAATEGVDCIGRVLEEKDMALKEIGTLLDRIWEKRVARKMPHLSKISRKEQKNLTYGMKSIIRFFRRRR